MSMQQGNALIKPSKTRGPASVVALVLVPVVLVPVAVALITGNDHGDNMVTATRVALGQPVPGTLADGDMDYFAVDVEAAGMLIVRTTGGRDTVGTLYHDGVSLDSDDNSGDGLNFEIHWEVSPGTYYVGVNGDNGDVGDYRFQAVFAGDDHGDDIVTATRVALEEPVPGTLADGDMDYFAVDVEAAGILIVRTTGGRDTVGTLYHDGVSLDSDDNSGDGLNFEIHWEVSPGTYYVGVNGDDGDVGTYRFQALTATRVALGQPVPGTLADGDKDYFAVDVEAAGTLTVRTTGGMDTIGALYRDGVSLYSENSDSPYSGHDGVNFDIRWEVSPGTYYVGVSARDVGEYLFQAMFDESVAPMFDESVASTYADGQVFQDCDFCPEMVVIPAGTFQMGSPASEEDRNDDEGPRHRVTLRSFALGVKEVTFDEWDACVRAGGCNGYRPDDEGWGRGARPVIRVNWENAQTYVSWLSEITGAQYRLPSESEWEYATRAGTTTPFHTGSTISTDQANYDRNRGRTTPVGKFAPNSFGLYDVHGNVWEFVEDCWHDDYSGAPSDGTAWTHGGSCVYRVLRGGSWSDDSREVRSAHRIWGTTWVAFRFIGFRVSRTLD